MLVILLAAIALAADETPVPRDAPKVEAEAAKAAPRIVTASVKDDKLVLRNTCTVAVPVTVVRKVKNKDGKEEDVAVTTARTETRNVEQSYELKKVTATTAGGKKVSADDLKKKLAKARPVVVSADGNAVDESYLKLFDKDVIVLVVPLTPSGGVLTPPLPPGPPVKVPKKD